MSMTALHQTVNASATLFGERCVLYLGMSEIQETRRSRLALTLESKNVLKPERARYMADRCDGGISYWSGLLSGHRPFGEKAARKAEVGLGLPPNWLDADGEPKRLGAEAVMLARAFDSVPDHTAELAARRDILLGNLLALIDVARHGPAGTHEQPQPDPATPLPLALSKTQP